MSYVAISIGGGKGDVGGGKRHFFSLHWRKRQGISASGSGLEKGGLYNHPSEGGKGVCSKWSARGTEKKGGEEDQNPLHLVGRERMGTTILFYPKGGGKKFPPTREKREEIEATASVPHDKEGLWGGGGKKKGGVCFFCFCRKRRGGKGSTGCTIYSKRGRGNLKEGGKRGYCLFPEMWA